MPRIRDHIFLATKTERRDRDGAWAQINQSLERLQAAVRAREEGLPARSGSSATATRHRPRRCINRAKRTARRNRTTPQGASPMHTDVSSGAQVATA
jgi:hypothetical protein